MKLIIKDQDKTFTTINFIKTGMNIQTIKSIKTMEFHQSIRFNVK